MGKRLLRFTVLIHEGEPGTWTKLPEFVAQRLTEDAEAGLEAIEEDLRFQLEPRRRKGELAPERLARTVLRVGRRECGTTQLEIDEERLLAGFDRGR